MNITSTKLEIDVNGLLIEYKTYIEHLLISVNSSPPVIVQKMFCVWNRGVPNKPLRLMPITSEVFSRVYELISYSTITYRVVMPNTCYSWHVDSSANSPDQNHNFHIPISTNEGCHFVYNGESHHMPADGNLYKVNNHLPHSFMNAGRTPRVHILFEN